MADEPKFYKRNWIDSAGDNAASTGQATLFRTYDRDWSLIWKSVGSNDAVQETLRYKFQVGGVAIQRTFDTVIVAGHNVKAMRVQKWDGASWTDIGGAAVTTETNDYTVFTFNAETAYGVGLRLDTTQDATPNTDKEVGEVWCLSTLWAPTNEAFSAIQIQKAPVGAITPTFNGGAIVNQTRWAGARTMRESWSIAFSLMSKTNYDSFLTVLGNGVFIAYLEPAQRPGELYLMTGIVEPPSAGYPDGTKGSYGIAARLLEV